MSIFFIKSAEQYRCDTEEEAKWLLEEAKKNYLYSVVKSSNEIKATKAKGEITDEWRRVIITKHFNDEKEPENHVMPYYKEAE